MRLAPVCLQQEQLCQSPLRLCRHGLKPLAMHSQVFQRHMLALDIHLGLHIQVRLSCKHNDKENTELRNFHFLDPIRPGWSRQIQGITVRAA